MHFYQAGYCRSKGELNLTLALWDFALCKQLQGNKRSKHCRLKKRQRERSLTWHHGPEEFIIFHFKSTALHTQQSGVWQHKDLISFTGCRWEHLQQTAKYFIQGNLHLPDWGIQGHSKDIFIFLGVILQRFLDSLQIFKIWYLMTDLRATAMN